MLKWILLASLLLTASASSADEHLKLQFKSAYKEYKKAVEENQTSSLESLARTSYQLGCQVYGQDNINCASLALNYARELDKRSKQLTPLHEKALTAFEKEYGQNSVELADVYFQIAEKNIGYQNRKSTKASKQAIKIANNLLDESPIASAQIKLKIGQVLLRNNSKLSRVILEAHNTFEENLEDNDYRLVESRFWLAKYLRAKGRTKKSTIPLEKNIELFEQIDGASHPYELASRAFLVEAYETTNQRDRATKHCIAIGNMTPWSNNQE